MERSVRVGLPIAAIFGLWSVIGIHGARVTQSAPLEPRATFVGAQACASCHQSQHETWRSGRHSRMLQAADPASVLGDFSTAGIVLHSRRFGLRRANGAFFIAESSLTGTEREHRVEYTLGSRRIQHYLTTLDNGAVVVLPPSWDVQRRRWFDNMDIVRPGRSPGTAVQQWNKDCVGCHVSGEEKNYRPVTNEYGTRWTDFGTSCERCHGPGSAHVTAHARTGGAPTGRRSIVKPTQLDPVRSSMICAQCHSLRNVIGPDFQAGDDYFDFFMPRLEYDLGSDRELPYWPDGRPRRFSNDAIGLWQSACFRIGQATCTTCHRDPHEPDVDRNPQLAASNNALCTQCHTDIGQHLTTHTQHAAGIAGSRCVECHMPKTVISLNATMRDHTISVPAPENSISFGIPNACTECHADKKPTWAVQVLNTWWPNSKRARLIERARAFAGGRRGTPAALDQLVAIASDAGAGPLIQATAVGYLRRYSGERARTALIDAATAAHPAIRATAIASLGAQQTGEDRAVQRVLVTALADPRRAVRIAALVSLINTHGSPLAAADLQRLQAVGREFTALGPLYGDDAEYDRDVGLVHLLDSDFNSAAEALQTCLRLEPGRPSVGFFLALARLGQGRIGDARALLERVPASDPSFAAARRRLELLRQ